MRAMKLIDPHTGEMKCRFCGSTHYSSLKQGGGYRRGSYVCCDDNCPSNQKVWSIEKQKFVKVTPGLQQA